MFVLKVVAFTIQRLIVVCSPLDNRFKSKSSAWTTVASVVCIAICINVWVPFMFQLKRREERERNFCSPNENLTFEYMKMTTVYLLLIIILPTCCILVSNLIIVRKSKRKDSQRSVLIKVSTVKKFKKTPNLTDSVKRCKSLSETRRKSFFLNFNQTLVRVALKSNSPKIMNKILLYMTTSYVALNLPYLVTLFVFFYFRVFIQNSNETSNNYLMSAVKSTEILYILGFGSHFYYYFCFGSLFRNKLEYSGILNYALI